MSSNLDKIKAQHEKNTEQFRAKGNSMKFLDLRNGLDDGETTLRVVPSESGLLTDTFVFRGKHRGIVPPNEYDLKRNPNADYKAAGCNYSFDDYCHICDFVNKAAESEDTDLRNAAQDLAVIPTVYFDAYILGKESEGLYVVTTTNKSVIDEIEGWINKSEPGGEYEGGEFYSLDNGHAITVKHTSKLRKDGKTQVTLGLQIGLKTVKIPQVMFKQRHDLQLFLKQRPDDEILGYLRELYGEAVEA